MAVIGNYSPDDYTVILSVPGTNFVHRVTGFSEGTFITLERLVPTSTPYQGVGEKSVGRVKRKITSMSATISLSQLSSSNDVLQALQAADADDSTSNEWVFACTVSDLSGTHKVSTNTAIIQAPASKAFADTMSSRDWMIHMFDSVEEGGGNMLLSDQEVTAIEATGGSVDPRWTISGQ